jgi:predicted amino acid-binding ACT domain protein
MAWTRFIKRNVIGVLGPKMRLWEFGRMNNSRIKIGEKLGNPLGLVDGCQVYTTMFRYDFNGNTGYEIVLSTFGPENYRQICEATFYMLDVPGSCAQVSKFLSERNIDILNSDSISMISNVTMVWKMLIDLSYYGELPQLQEDFDTLKKQKSSSISNIDTMDIKESHISDRYTKGISGRGQLVKAKALKKASKAPSMVKNGEIELPTDYLKMLEGVKDGDPVMMVGDTDSWVLSLTFMKPTVKLAQIEIEIPDKPGSIFEVTNQLARFDINLLALHTKVLVFYEKMSMELVADVSKYPGGAIALKDGLQTMLSGLKGNFKLSALKEIRV